ncbi:response regulator [Caballeronia sp. GAWG1-1]|uniref:response regulator n=1 Tax=Caballeronia sp. GAWG1-1 TaxID=2921742 RepID=UPI00202798B4|nr:response regulator [Caballeronia sp. GAWG1-1]
MEKLYDSHLMVWALLEAKQCHAFVTAMSTSPSPLLGLWSVRQFDRVDPPIIVLIIDDDPVGAEALAAVLTGEGFRTLVLAEGSAVFNAPSAWTPHVVVLDIEMPISDGFSVALSMRGSVRFARTPIIAYSSLAEAEVIARGKEAEIDAFCRKGHSPRSLIALIEHVAPLGLS